MCIYYIYIQYIYIYRYIEGGHPLYEPGASLDVAKARPQTTRDALPDRHLRGSQVTSSPDLMTP